MTRVSRRTLLGGITSTVTAGLLAGCSGNGNGEENGDGAESEDDTESETGSDEGDETESEDGSEQEGTEEETGDDSESSMPEPETVRVGPDAQNVFDPETLEIEAGTEVTFVWESSGHSLVVGSQPDGADWSGVPDTQSSGHEHVKVFEVPGTYEYHCEPHQAFGMEGTITVTEG